MFVAALVLTLVDVILAVTLREELVYPELLQQRSDDGRLLLRIDRDMTLQLQRSSVLADDLFFSTNAGGKSENTLWNGSRIQENLYHDSKHQSSVMLYQDGPHFESRRHIKILHKVYEIEDPKREFGKSLDTWVIPFNVPWFDIPWGASDVHESQFGTNEELIAYIAIMMNAVNIWYEGMENPRIRVKVVGITRNKDGEFEVKEDGFLIADRTINNFAEYAQTQIPGKPDAVYLITSQDLAAVSYSGSIDNGVAGLAYVGMLCGPRNVAIGEDPAGSFKGVYPAAHELAHTLGSVHDGYAGVDHIPDHPGAKDCPWEEGLPHELPGWRHQQVPVVAVQRSPDTDHDQAFAPDMRGRDIQGRLHGESSQSTGSAGQSRGLLHHFDEDSRPRSCVAETRHAERM
ncbi:hypothetical protein MTO96_014739 [Rhipicephalus appendiculatus]